MADWESICDGCVSCAMRCTDGIKISESEYTRIVALLRTLDPTYVRTVLEQPKERPWCEGVTYTACPFIDQSTCLCLIYPARPLVCRLFGTVPFLPCPEGKVASDVDARRVVETYARQQLLTFREWMAAHGVSDFGTFLATLPVR